MIIRKITPVLRNFSQQYPVVTLTGPRQSGKTTLSKMAFPDNPYVNLEDLEERDFAREDPKGFLNRFPHGAILDEIQRIPELLSYIQVQVDLHSEAGQFILTGSHNFLLMENVSQSLAGRTALLTLLPFDLGEAYPNRQELSLDEVIYKGFYPRIIDKNLDPSAAYSFYLNTYIEKDLRSLLNVRDLTQFETFLKICATRVGQVVNLSGISNDTGVSHNTIKQWLSILEHSYIIKLIRPYYKNISKRLIKSPKLYFYDTGLACHLLGIHHPEHVSAHPLRGSLFENMVIMESIKNHFNQGKPEAHYYLRDHKQVEIDLIIEGFPKNKVYEIKSSQTLSSQFFKGIRYYQKDLGDVDSYIIYGGEKHYTRENTKIMGWRKIQW